MSKSSLNVVLLGAPGAGKGTQAELLVRDLGLIHLSTGNLLREAVAAGTPLGRRAASYMTGGQLVPDQVIIDLVKEFVKKEGPCGYLLDGFPRTVPQAQALDAMLSAEGLHLDYAIEVKTDPELIVSRLQHRLVCRLCGAPYHAKNKPPKVEGVCDSCRGNVQRRLDDEPETIRKRLAVYEAETAPLISYYQKQGILVTVDGDLSREETYEQIKVRLGLGVTLK